MDQLPARSAAIRQRLLRLLPGTADRVWLVGGAVRNLLLDREVRDIDLLVALPPERLVAAGFRPVRAKTTPDIWFRHLPGFGSLEATLLAGPAGLADDLRRRDFTINAVALSLAGELVDPLAGIVDLAARRLAAASEGVFAADPLRLLRALRFMADGFVPDQRTVGLLRGQTLDAGLAGIPAERSGRELLRALATPAPAEFFRGLVDHGIGRSWLPELFRMGEVPAGPVEHHPEGDLLIHSLQVLEQVAAAVPDPMARFCALFHDLGKLATPVAAYPKHHGHEEAGAGLADRFCRRLALPAAYGRALAAVCRLHGSVNRFAELRPATRLRLVEQAGRAGVDGFLLVIAAADKPGPELQAEWQRLAAIVRLTAGELGVAPERLAAVPPAQRGDLLLQKRVELLQAGGGL